MFKRDNSAFDTVEQNSNLVSHLFKIFRSFFNRFSLCFEDAFHHNLNPSDGQRLKMRFRLLKHGPSQGITFCEDVFCLTVIENYIIFSEMYKLWSCIPYSEKLPVTYDKFLTKFSGKCSSALFNTPVAG